MVIERATVSDAPAILTLLQQNALPTAGVVEHVGTAFVAREGTHVVGCVVLELYGATALLRSLAVSSNWRGRGLGQQLTRSAMDWARHHDVADLYLLTETASGFFPRFGFVAIDRAAVSPTIHPSVEWTSACPTSALVMHTLVNR